MLKTRITAKQLGKMTPEMLVTKVALEAVGYAANKAIEARVTGPSQDADGRRLPRKRVKEYKRRGKWIPAKSIRMTRERRTARREAIGRVKEAREDKRFFGAEGHTPSVTPVDIFQQMRQLGGVFRSKAAYEADGLKGGTAIVASRDFTWLGVKWSAGDVWGYRWPDADAFHSSQGVGSSPDLGGRGSRVWRSMTAKAAVRRNGTALLTLGFKGRRPRGDAAQVLSDWGTTTETGRARKKSTAEIAAVANSRDRHGMVARPQTTGGRPVGGTAPLSRRIGESEAVRWHRLSDREIATIILPGISQSAIDAFKNAPTKVILVEGRKR